jgi:phage-related protein
MESEHFIFDNINSEDMGLYIVRIESGFVETPYWGGQDILEEKIPKRDTPYFYGVDRQPIEFTIQFSLLDEEFTPQRRKEIARWLLHDNYKSFQTCDDLGKIYYVICTNPTSLFLANTKGYFEIVFRVNSFSAFTPIYIQDFDLSNNTTTVIQMSNLSNIVRKYYPKIEVELVGDATGFSLKNLSNNGLITSFSNLELQEVISVVNKNKWIISSVPSVYRFNNFNKQWFYLVEGVNNIEISGKILLQTKSQFPIIQ